MQQIATALVKAQRDFAPALKTSTNPHFRSRYADLAACVEAVIDALNANGIAMIQRTHDSDNGVAVETLFVHESGETITGGILHVPAAKHDPQGYGSALTYARRYSLMAACGIAPEDDDANAAQRTPVNAQSRSARVSIPTAKDGSVTATINPPAGEVTVTPSPERIAEVEKILRACKSLVNLQVEWGSLTKEEQKAATAAKDEVKAVLLAEQKGATGEKTPNPSTN
jgi:hypothetical protein